MAKLIKAKQWLQWHNKLGWWSLAAILIWVLSGASHPLMSWLGPKADKFFPPSMTLALNDVQTLPQLIGSPALAGAKLLKVVPTGDGPMLQVTKDLSSSKRYYSLKTGEPIADYDQQQAAWLGSHYTGRADDEIETISFITEFSSDYPWINRLLPVYKIRYRGNDNLTAFVYTETAALASLNNNTKASVQWFFQHLHTFKFLNGFEWGRLIIAGLFMLTLIAMAIIGFGLVCLLKSRKISSTPRRYHRLFAYVLWLPLLTWSASGFYHLLQSSLIESPAGMRLGSPLNVNQNVGSDMAWVLKLRGQSLNYLSLIQYKDAMYYRASVFAAQAEAGNVSRAKKYRGVPSEQKAIYVNATTGLVDEGLTDQLFAESLAIAFSGMSSDNIDHLSLVTRFGANYDFRNKRLPVWQISFKDKNGLNLFVDPSTGILVDQTQALDRVERWSFSNLHKWSFLTPFTGRFWRDVAILTTLFSLFIIASLGAVLLFQKSKAKKV